MNKTNITLSLNEEELLPLLKYMLLLKLQEFENQYVKSKEEIEQSFQEKNIEELISKLESLTECHKSAGSELLTLAPILDKVRSISDTQIFKNLSDL